MTENEEKKTETTTVRLYVRTLDAFKDEQHRLRKQGKTEPTYAQLAEEAWALYEQRRDGKQPIVMQPLRKNLHTTSIDVPNEIAEAVGHIVAVLAKPGGLEEFKRFVDRKAEDAMIATELQQATAAGGKGRKR